eukprot:1161956-Pelagomonas_calceolata.AAC.13
MPLRMQEFHKQHDENEHLGQNGDPRQAHQTAIRKEELHKEREANDTDFGYTIAAARRSEQRRLLVKEFRSEGQIDLSSMLVMRSVQVEVLPTSAKGSRCRAGVGLP